MGKFEEMQYTKIHDEYQFCTFNLPSQIHHLNFHRKKGCFSIFFHRKCIFPRFSIFISARILVSATNSRFCSLHDSLNITGILVAALSGTWHYRISTETGWPMVRVLSQVRWLV